VIFSDDVHIPWFERRQVTCRRKERLDDPRAGVDDLESVGAISNGIQYRNLALDESLLSSGIHPDKLEGDATVRFYIRREKDLTKIPCAEYAL
jgi:hypothetical protein